MGLSNLFNVPPETWENWKWQIKNKITSNNDIKEFFPHITQQEVDAFNDYISKFYFGITPYTLSLVELDEEGTPVPHDPIWNQFRYFHISEMSGDTDYDGSNENWEEPEELPTKILQHKYIDRAIVRITNTCFGHCNYCYLTSRVLDKSTSKVKAGNREEWEKSLAYLRENPQIRDVLISGGDPLILNNNKIDNILKDLSNIASIKSVRINTRVFTFNPYRFDEELVKILKKYQLTALELQIVHPHEINEVVDTRLELFDKIGYRPLLLWRAPLLKGINASVETLEELFTRLYQRRITPYYLFHYAPFALGRSCFGLSVRKGCEIMKDLRRRIPGPAFPRYTLFHIEGKHDIPLEPEGTPTFIYSKDKEGNPIIRFKNWKGKWVEYNDIIDS